MKLSSTRSLAELKTVLKDPNSLGPDPAYWVFDEVSKDRWFNNTLLSPGKHSAEYNKTFGHYHPEDAPLETYKLIHGKGVFLMQKKHQKEGVLIADRVDEVYVVQMEVGDEVVIQNNWGHALINLGELPLITFDDWKGVHAKSDYEPIEKVHGMAYYLTEENGQLKAVPNPNYQNLPEIKWITAAQFNQLS